MPAWYTWGQGQSGRGLKWIRRHQCSRKCQLPQEALLSSYCALQSLEYAAALALAWPKTHPVAACTPHSPPRLRLECSRVRALNHPQGTQPFPEAKAMKGHGLAGGDEGYVP